MFRVLFLSAGLSILAFADEVKKPDFPLVFSDDFEKGADRWEPSDPKGWKITKTDRGNVFSQHQKASAYKPPHRSPFHIALVKDVVVGDFIFEARCRSTVKDYGHRDLCLFFGHQDAGHFYYVHLGKKTDDHANQIFIVDGAARKKISTKTTPGTDWDDAWHTVRVIRKADAGTIEVFFDDMKKPVMTATDRKFLRGRVGVGSFDDTGDWDDVKLWGTRVEKK